MKSDVQIHHQAKIMMAVLVLCFPLLLGSAFVLKNDSLVSSKRKKEHVDKYSGYAAIICSSPLAFLITKKKLAK